MTDQKMQNLYPRNQTYDDGTCTRILLSFGIPTTGGSLNNRYTKHPRFQAVTSSDTKIDLLVEIFKAQIYLWQVNRIKEIFETGSPNFDFMIIRDVNALVETLANSLGGLTVDANGREKGQPDWSATSNLIGLNSLEAENARIWLRNSLAHNWITADNVEISRNRRTDFGSVPIHINAEDWFYTVVNALLLYFARIDSYNETVLRQRFVQYILNDTTLP